MLRNVTLIPKSRVILGKLIVAQLAKNIPSVYEDQRFITVCTRAGHSIQS
jgi:hypothetical protein